MDETSKSLLVRLQEEEPEQDAWNALVDCYTPFLRAILLARGIELNALDDVMQNVFTVVVRRIGDFDRQRTGSFRSWLRAICANCLREQVRKRMQGEARGAVGSGETKMVKFIQELSDPNSDLSRFWDKKHDEFVLDRLLGRVQDEFRPTTFQAFKRLAIQHENVDEVAADLGISVNAAFVARSRVLKRLKELAKGMVEE